jgi:hypothetical protein
VWLLLKTLLLVVVFKDVKYWLENKIESSTRYEFENVLNFM